jgi:hypothetical protein
MDLAWVSTTLRDSTLGVDSTADIDAKSQARLLTVSASPNRDRKEAGDRNS